MVHAAAVQVLTSLEAVGEFKIVDIALFSLLVWDWIISFDDELSVVWMGSFTLPKFCFVVARYLTLATQSVQLSFGITINQERKCHIPLVASIIIMSFGIFIFTEALMLMRTIAFYRGKKKVYFLIFFMFIISCLAGIISLVFWVRDLRAFTGSFELDGVACNIASKNQAIILGTFGVLLAWEAIISGLVLRRSWVESYRYCKHCGNESGLRMGYTFWDLLYKHGFVFYLCTLGITVINLVLLIRGEDTIINAILLSAERTMHSLAATRLILFTRLQSQPSIGDDTETTITGDVPLEEFDADHGDEEDEDGKMDYSDSEHPQSELEEIEPLPRRSNLAISVPHSEMLGPAINVLPPSPTAPGHDRH